MSDSHFQKITGYEVVGEGTNSYLRFKIEDPGYQHDTYMDADTMQPYHFDEFGDPKFSTEHNKGVNNRDAIKIKVLE